MTALPSALQPILDLLNEASVADIRAMEQLLNCRVPCNKTLANHPTIQVGGDDNDSPVVGSIGLINGITERLTGKRVAAVYDDQWNLLRFEEYKP